MRRAGGRRAHSRRILGALPRLAGLALRAGGGAPYQGVFDLGKLLM